MPPRTVSGNWSTIEALTPGTELAVYVGEEEVRFGRLSGVSAHDVTLTGQRSIESFSRSRIERVALRISTGASHRGPIVKMAVIGAIVSTALAWLAQAWAENPPHDQFKWKFVVAGTAAGAAIGSQRAPAETFRERLIYIRP